MTKRRIVVDTNVLISAIMFGGKPREVLRRVLARDVECCISTPLLDELRGVLERPKFGFSREQAAQVAEELRDVCQLIEPQDRLTVVREDPPDNRVLECAIECGAQVVITGDLHLLRLETYGGVVVLTPADYLEQG